MMKILQNIMQKELGIPEVHEFADEMGNIVTSRVCRVTRRLYSVTVDREQWLAWKRGAYAQDVFRDLTADQCEFLITNTTPAEFEQMFPEEE